MADGSDVLLFMIFIYVALLVKRPCFITSSGIKATTEEFEETRNEVFINSSIWVSSKAQKSPFVNRFSSKSLLLTILLACGDVESCPGPSYDALKKKGITSSSPKYTRASS